MSKYNAETIKKECECIAAKFGYKFNVPVEINSRLKVTYGRTHFVKECGVYTPTKLDFNETYIINGSDAEVLDTIRHEMAHYLLLLERPEENHNHDTYWKNWCLKVGARPEATAQPSNNSGIEGKIKYRIYCTECGKLVGEKTRKCKTVTYPQLYKSACCKAPIVVKQ